MQIKTLKNIQKQDRERISLPETVQDAVPIKRIWEDGIFLSGNKYTKSWKFTDINYRVASEEDKKTMFFAYSDLLNGLDSGATTKITINNHHMRRTDFEGSVLLPLKHDGLDQFRSEYNEMLLSKALDASGVFQEKYITVSILKHNIEEARRYFSRTEVDLSARLSALGSKCMPINAIERLKILHDFYNADEQESYTFDIAGSARKGHSFKDYICPDSMDMHSDFLKIGGRYARTLFIKDFANFLKDSFISNLTDISRNMMLSIDIITIPTDEAVREVESRLLGVETNIANWQRKQNQNNNFSAIVPYDMDLQRRETKEFLDDISTRDQRMMMAVITIVITADTKTELDQDTKSVLALAQGNMCQVAVLRYQQLDGLNTALPIGVRKIDVFRTLTTESLAILMPFKVQEVQDKGGIYYGQNAISKNLILINRDNLSNQSAVVSGVPGSGKSLGCKSNIAVLGFNTDDSILIFDPEGEYVPLVKTFGDKASIIRMAAGGKDHINAMSMVDGYGENDPIVVKSEFIMSLIEQIDKRGVGPQQKSIIDRCIGSVYKSCYEKDIEPTLCILREELLKQPEPEGKDLALTLELYTTGSLDIFGRESNVDLDKPIILFDAHGLGAQLKPTGLLVITDAMLNIVTRNWKAGRKTHIFIDEVHVVFENPYSAQFFASAWRQFRKRNASPTAITQNVEYLLSSVEGRTMLSNSELVVMYNQAETDREELSRLLNISPEQQRYITNVDPGSGLIRYGGALVPFINRFPRDTKLYQLMTTRPGEGEFSRKNNRST